MTTREQLASFAFIRDGVGVRLLGALGHADLRRFARSDSPCCTALAGSLPGQLLAPWFGPKARTAVDFLGVLRDLGSARTVLPEADPMRYRRPRWDRAPRAFPRRSGRPAGPA